MRFWAWSLAMSVKTEIGKTKSQVQVVDHTTHPPKCHSFVGLDKQIGSSPPALLKGEKKKKESEKFYIYLDVLLHTHTRAHTHTPHTHTQNTIKTAKNRLDKDLTILLSSGSQTWQRCSKMLSDIVIFCKVRNQRGRTMNNPGYPAQKLAFKRICYASLYGLWTMLMARSPMSMPFT